MIEIIREKYLRPEEDLDLTRCEICVDTAEELPGIYDFSGKKLAQGSIAWDISTGDLYGLNSSGEWYNQNGDGAANKAATLSSNTSAKTLLNSQQVEQFDNLEKPPADIYEQLKQASDKSYEELTNVSADTYESEEVSADDLTLGGFESE